MKLQSGHHLGLPAPPRPAGGSGGGTDHISALPDDLLLLVLARLDCVRTAARAGVLSRRWRGLWTGLSSLVFRDVAFSSLEGALDSVVSSASAVSRLEIRLPDPTDRKKAPRISVPSLLRVAARLSPEQVVLAVPWGPVESAELSCLQRATSISLSVRSPIILRAPAVGVLPALTTLVLSGCTADHLADLVLCCPRLRVLRYTFPAGFPLDITIRSASLQELVLEDTQRGGRWVRQIDIVVPMLERLTLSCRVSDLGVSVLAPMASNISWRCRYNQHFMELGDWTLETVSLLSAPMRSAAADRPRPPVLRIDATKETCGYRYVLWTQDDFSREVEKHLRMRVAVDLSVLNLELRLQPLGHVYGAVVFFFLGMHAICTTVRKLKVVVPRSMAKERCQEYCGCEPADWTSQTVSLMKLEEVEVDRFQGNKREFDFLEHVLRCAPML